MGEVYNELRKREGEVLYAKDWNKLVAYVDKHEVILRDPIFTLYKNRNVIYYKDTSTNEYKEVIVKILDVEFIYEDSTLKQIVFYVFDEEANQTIQLKRDLIYDENGNLIKISEFYK